MPLLADPAALQRGGRPAGGVGASRASRTWSSARRPAASSSAARSRTSSAAASSPRAGRGSCRGRRSASTYALEYGENSLELHADAIANGARVLVHDDVLATGGTARAICDLVEQLGGEVVGVGFLIELDVPQRTRSISRATTSTR